MLLSENSPYPLKYNNCYFFIMIFKSFLMHLILSSFLVVGYFPEIVIDKVESNKKLNFK